MTTVFLPRLRWLAAKRHAHGALDAEDLVQAGAIAVLKARRRWDPKKGLNWRDYALARAGFAMTDAARDLDHVPRLERYRAKRDGRTIRQVLSREGQAVDVARQGGDRATTPAAAELAGRRDLWAQLPRLLRDVRLAEVLERYYRRDETLLEIGQAMRLSESRTCQLHARALARLRSRLPVMEALP